MSRGESFIIVPFMKIEGEGSASTQYKWRKQHSYLPDYKNAQQTRVDRALQGRLPGDNIITMQGEQVPYSGTLETSDSNR